MQRIARLPNTIRGIAAMALIAIRGGGRAGSARLRLLAVAALVLGNGAAFAVSAAGPPPMPTGLHVAGATTSTITWGWTNPDPSALIGYTVDGVSLHSLAAGTTTFSNTINTPGGWGCMSIAAYNDSGASTFTPYVCSYVVPRAPDNFNNFGVTTSTMSFTWSNGDTIAYEQAFDYRVGVWVELGNNATQYTLTGLEAGNLYCLAVRAYNANYVSDIGMLCMPTTPNPPTDLHATTITPTAVTFAWTRLDPTSAYAVYDPTEGHRTNGTSFTTTNIIPSGGHGYACVYVAAWGFGGSSPYVLACAWAY